MKKILIIEDEKSISRFLQLELKHEGYDCDAAYEGRSGLDKALSGNFDLIILDLMLPNVNGTQICKIIRSEGVTTPVIMLTAKDDVSDKVMGFDVGADDYMTKPFAIEELLARIRAALKKQNRAEETPVLKAGRLSLNRDKFEVYFDNEPITLTKKEFDLLAYMMLNKNLVLSRDKLVENVWGYEYEGETNVTDVYIRYLRSKIDQVYNTNYFRTVRGIGYQFKTDDDKDEEATPKKRGKNE